MPYQGESIRLIAQRACLVAANGITISEGYFSLSPEY